MARPGDRAFSPSVCFHFRRSEVAMQAKFENSPPPLLLHDVIEDRDAVIALLEGNAPYTPLGGWFSPGADREVEFAKGAGIPVFTTIGELVIYCDEKAEDADTKVAFQRAAGLPSANL